MQRRRDGQYWVMTGIEVAGKVQELQVHHANQIRRIAAGARGIRTLIFGLASSLRLLPDAMRCVNYRIDPFARGIT